MLGFIKLVSGLIEEKRVSSVLSIMLRFKHLNLNYSFY
jgi:hypothetical protein